MPEEHSGKHSTGIDPAVPGALAGDKKRSGVSLRAIVLCAAFCVSAFALALHLAPSQAEVGEASSEQTAGDEIVAAIEREADAGMAESAAVKAAEPRLAEAVEPGPAQSAPAVPAVAPRLARFDEYSDLERLQPLSADDQRWGAVRTQPTGGDEQLKRKLTEAGRRLKSLMEADAPHPPAEAFEESPQLAYARPADPEPEVEARPQEPAFDGAELVDARTRDHVNLRGAARKGAPVLGVIPKGAAIKVARECSGWCATVHDGRKGYIYKDFVQRAAAPAGTAAKPASAAAAQATAAEAQPAKEEPAKIRTVLPKDMTPRQGGQ